MDTINTQNLNEFEAPQGDAMASRLEQFFSPPGSTFSIAPENDPKSSGPKNPEISSVPASLTETKVAVVVGAGEYKPEYGPQMYEWFCAKEKFHVSFDSYTWKNGAVSEKERRVPNPPPHFSEFAREIGVTHATLKRWAKAHKEFADAYEACTDIIQEFYIDNGVTGAYAGQFSIFAAKNTTKMRDVIVNRNENWNMKDVLDAIEKGVNPNDQHDI